MVHLIINVWMAEKIFQFTIARTHIPSALYRISKYLLLKNLKLSTPPRPCLFYFLWVLCLLHAKKLPYKLM